MSPDSEPLRRVPAPADELDAEREVDFGGYARTIVGKWWLLVIGAVVGGVLGFLYGQTGGSSFQAEATIYLGQPLSPSGSAPALVVERPDGGRHARAQPGRDQGRLGRGRHPRGEAAAEHLCQRPRRAHPADDERRAHRHSRARERRREGRGRVQPHRGAGRRALLHLRRRQGGGAPGAPGRPPDQAGLRHVPPRRGDGQPRGDAAGSATEQLLQANLLGVLEQQRADLQDDVIEAEQLLQAVQEVERARVVSPAASRQVDARNAGTSAIVGAFLGLVLAALAALLWAPVARLRAT